MGLCKNPYREGIMSYGCGRCPPCRIQRRRLWTHRIILESLKHSENSFLTLTLSNGFLSPTTLGGCRSSLIPRQGDCFLKRLRKHFGQLRLRYYMVGEYGDQSERPHFHLALFGVSAIRIAGKDCDGARPAFRDTSNGRVFIGDPLRSIWGLGNVYAAELNEHTANYVAGYVTKRLTNKNDPKLQGRYPEFARMSRHPGLGSAAMADVSASLLSHPAGAGEISRLGDVPNILRHGAKKYPLGRYLKRRLRLELGFASMEPREEGCQKVAWEMRRMHEEAREVAGVEAEVYLAAVEKQKILNLETRSKILGKRRVL